MHHHRPIQRGISAIFIVIFTLALATAITSAYFIFSQNQTQKLNTINSFEDCAKYYPVMESYPQQCNTPDGKHFTRQLSEEEKERLVPPTQSSPSSQSTETANWKTYKNDKFKYSISYPQDFKIDDKEPSMVSLNNGLILISVDSNNPENCRGDCSNIKKTESIQINNIRGRAIYGEIGAVGGRTPQSYYSIILPIFPDYYVFSIYELENAVAEWNENRIIQSVPQDKIDLLNKITNTFVYQWPPD